MPIWKAKNKSLEVYIEGFQLQLTWPQLLIKPLRQHHLLKVNLEEPTIIKDHFEFIHAILDWTILVHSYQQASLVRQEIIFVLQHLTFLMVPLTILCLWLKTFSNDSLWNCLPSWSTYSSTDFIDTFNYVFRTMFSTLAACECTFALLSFLKVF